MVIDVLEDKMEHEYRAGAMSLLSTTKQCAADAEMSDGHAAAAAEETTCVSYFTLWHIIRHIGTKWPKLCLCAVKKLLAHCFKNSSLSNYFHVQYLLLSFVQHSLFDAFIL